MEAKFKNAPQVMQYLNYRDYMRDYFEYQKSININFSQRNFAREIGLPVSCSSLWPAIVKGRRNLSANLRIKFGKAMQLNEREYSYFELLVQFNQAKGMVEKNHFFASLSKFRSSKAQIVNATQYKFYSKWYYSAVRNYFCIDEKQRHPQMIAGKIFPALTTAQVEESIELLLELDLIKKTAAGYKVTNKHISTEKDVQAMAAKQHILELIDMSQEVFEKVPANSRQYNALMFSVSEKGFQTIKDRIRSFQEELREIIDKDEKEDRLYTLNMQLFPNSKAH